MAGPLAGVRIVDLTTMLMAPYATQILGDMGADVIKVEAPEGDPLRGIGPMRHPGMGAIALHVNRSKRSLVLDLKKPEGVEAIRALLRGADILVYNLRPQSMARLGLGYDVVRSLNPRIIYAGLYGFGQDGPYAALPAFDDLIQGLVAVPWLAQQAKGGAAGGEPAYAPTAIVDRGVALWAVGQISAALYHRARTGEGQKIDMPMFEMMAGFVLGDHLAGEAFDPPLGPPGYVRMLNRHRHPFRTKDGYLCAMIYTDKHWRAFFRALGREAEFDADPRYRSMTTRTQHIEAIYRELAELLLSRKRDEWLRLFAQADVPATPLHDLDSLLRDPHLAATGFFGVEDHPTEGRLRTMAYPSRWSATQPAASRPVPRPGEHSVELLREIGYSEERIAALVRSGATATAAVQGAGEA
jgi:crotonobetainyl-CoA:carnitine CoA-transferase CaiB-like acyl-CoA transferase